MKIFLRTLVSFLCSLIFASAAEAQHLGWYGGGSVGQGKMDITAGDWDIDGTLTNIKLDTETVTAKAIVGYQFTRHFALEGSFIHFGDSDFSAFEPATTSSVWQFGQVGGQARVKGVAVEGMLDWPFFEDRYSVFAKGGLFMWNTTMKSSPTIAGGTLALGDETVVHDDGVRWIYGVGADMRLYRRWHLRVEWEQATVGFAHTIDRTVDFVSLGVTLDF